MKKLLILACIGVFILIASEIAIAGDYHKGEQLLCYQCHTMHASQTHPYDSEEYIVPSEPIEYLLRDEVNDLCLSCHDGEAGVPDVLGSNNGNPADDREAGALNEIGGVGTYSETDGHTLGSTATAPGNGSWSEPDGLNCANCHQPHGYAGYGTTDIYGTALSNAYRNLYTDRGGATDHKNISYAVSTNDLTKDVYEVVSAEYDDDNVFLNEPVTNNSGFGNWCNGCHVDFHGSAGSPNMGGEGGEEWLRHPVADADIGAVGGGHSSKSTFAGNAYKVKVMTATENWDPQSSGEVTDHTPTCLSCHKAHGNNNPFGIIYADGAAELGEDGDGDSVRDLCIHCHVQGG